MKEKILRFANLAWTAAKNPVGSAIIGGVSGSTATHVFNKSKQIQDLEEAQSDCKNLEEQIKKMEIINIESESFNRSLTQRNDLLRDEIRQVDRHVGKLETNFNNCRYSLATMMTVHKNSWCFWKYSSDKQINNQELEISSNNDSVNIKK